MTQLFLRGLDGRCVTGNRFRELLLLKDFLGGHFANAGEGASAGRALDAPFHDVDCALGVFGCALAADAVVAGGQRGVGLVVETNDAHITGVVNLLRRAGSTHANLIRVDLY